MRTDPEIVDVITDIRRRAQSTPNLVAVRMAGRAITYRQLDEGLAGYGEVLERYGMSDGSSFAAALMHCAPGLGQDAGEACARRINDAALWLGRGLEPRPARSPHRQLRQDPHHRGDTKQGAPTAMGWGHLVPSEWSATAGHWRSRSIFGQVVCRSSSQYPQECVPVGR